jgi:Flp pilus assembly protein TadG
MSIAARLRAAFTRMQESAHAARLRLFAGSTRANVAMIFALSLVPLTIGAGAGLDLARAMVVRDQLSEALDAAGLAIAGTPGLTQGQMQTMAQQYFNANYKADSSYGTPVLSPPAVSGQSVTVSASVSMPTTLLNAVGYSTLPITESSTVVWGQQKLWVSLVLDNTGSMTQTDSSGLSKITALKSATHQLLTLLQNASSTAGDVQVAIVPFARDVKIGTSYSSATWLDWTNWSATPPTPSTSVGPGSNCPWSDNVNGYHCSADPANAGADANQIPSSGTYKGYICPSLNTVGYYYNGCFNSVSSNGHYNHTWVPNAKSTWTGCVTDRTQNYDSQNTTPTTGTAATLFPADNSPSCPVTQLLALGYNWTTLSNEVDAMVANGSTNQTIGLAWGWQALTQGSPLSAPALPANTQQVIILLSDGLNTQDRWYGDGSNQSTQVDARMSATCANAKAAKITIYTVFVDINGTQGNSSVLQNCATDTTKYFDLTSSGQIAATFNQIGQQITNLRVSQ